MGQGRDHDVTVGPYNRFGFVLLWVVLISGPIIAGFSQHPVAVLPVYAGFFLIFTAMMRRPSLHTPTGWATLAIMAVLQIFVAVAFFVTGMLFAQSLGALTAPLWLPIALTGVAAIYGALSFTDSAEMDVFLDGAIEKLRKLDEGIVADWTQVHPDIPLQVQSHVDHAVQEAIGLHDPVGPGLVDPIATRLAEKVGVAGFDALYDAAGLDHGPAHLRTDLLYARFIALPRIQRHLIERGEAGMAAMLLLNAPDPMLRAEAVQRVEALAQAGLPADQLPDPMWLQELNADYPGEGFDRLKSLRSDLSKGSKTR